MFARDLTLLGFGPISAWDIDSSFQKLDDSEGLITESLHLGDYYNAVGHNDVVYRVLRRFEESPDDIPEYPLIVVDEYQDFNPLETSLIRKLEQRSPVLIAGDDDQALYHRKHASPEFIRELAVDDDYAKFVLPFCSRCTAVIVDAVNNVIDARCSVDSLTTPYIARYVAEQIAQIPAEDIARSVDGRYPTVLVRRDRFHTIQAWRGEARLGRVGR